MCELYRMSDTVEIVERDGIGRVVALVGGGRSTATSPTEDEVCAVLVVILTLHTLHRYPDFRVGVF